jgi:hypothetical protein
MNKLTLTFVTLAIALAGAASTAFAEDITPDNYRDTVSVKTRQQVAVERDQAKRDGSVKVWSTTYNPLTVAKSLTTRGAVLAEEKAAQADGTLNAYNGEDSGSFALARAAARQQGGSVVAGNVRSTQ